MSQPHQNDPAQKALELVRRLEESGALGNGGRLPALLRYLVGEELAGRGERIKAYAIATDVLGRGQSFDPQQDSIVRVEIARLRKALDYYYATTGSDDPYRITIPRGSYRPLLGAEPAATPGDEAAEPITSDVMAPSPSARHRGLLAFAFLALVALAAGVGWFFRPAPVVPPLPSAAAYSVTTPRLVLLPVQTSTSEDAALAPGLRAQIADLLSRQSWLAVSVEDNFVPQGSLPSKVFSLSLVLNRESSGFALRALLHSEPDHRLVWSARYANPMLHKPTFDLAAGLANDLARDLGYPLGPIGRAVAARSDATEAEVEDRFLCTMNAYRYWQTLGAKQRADAVSCLTRLTERKPDYAEGRAMLAMLTLEESREFPGASSREAALAKVESLLRGAPADDRLSVTARMMYYACKGEVEPTKAHARALYALAPNDPDSLAEVALAAGLSALDWDFALTAETRAFELATRPHARYAHTRAARLLLAGNHEAALQAISRVPQRGLSIGQTMLLAIATLADAPLRASAAADALAIGFSQRTEQLTERIDSTCWHPSVKAAFRQAITSHVPGAR